jgi:hypothetical protein
MRGRSVHGGTGGISKSQGSPLSRLQVTFRSSSHFSGELLLVAVGSSCCKGSLLGGTLSSELGGALGVSLGFAVGLWRDPQDGLLVTCRMLGAGLDSALGNSLGLALGNALGIPLLLVLGLSLGVAVLGETVGSGPGATLGTLLGRMMGLLIEGLVVGVAASLGVTGKDGLFEGGTDGTLDGDIDEAPVGDSLGEIEGATMTLID